MRTPFHERLILCSLALWVGLAVPCAAQPETEAPHHFASLQLFHPLATSPNPETTTNFRLSVLYGRSGGIRGLDLNLAAGINSGDAVAFQVTGLYAQTRGLFQGLSVTGGLSHLKNGGAGFQIAGLANYDEDAFGGLMAAGILNYTGRGFAGAQISSALNINDGAGTFLQLASLANVNGGPFAGIQASVFLNAANSRMGGGQLGILNFAESMNGVQVGIINMSDEGHGLRVGLVNTGNEFSGTSIGLVNKDLNSRREWMIYGSNLSLVNIGYRTVLNDWASIVSTGYGDTRGDVGEALFFGWNFGRNIPLAEKWEVTVDLGYQHIIPKSSDNPLENDRLHYSLQARVLADYRLNDKLGLVGSVGTSTVFAEYASDAASETDFHFTAGVVLY